MDTYALVDFYNLPQAILNAGATSLVSQMDSLVRSTNPDTQELFVRFYGGWYDEAGLSNDGTLLVQEISKNFPRPIRTAGGGISHTHCAIASSLLQVRGELFFATLRERRGMARFDRTPTPPGCINAASCTAPNVIEWSRKGCPTTGCPVSSSDAFLCKQQKLVDILLCCDLVTLATAGLTARVFLVSEDDDFIPAIILASSLGATVWHVRTKQKKVRLYDAMLLRNKVNIVTI
jgi:hypothetical protein